VRIVKKLIAYFLAVLLILVFSFPLWVKFLPVRYLPFLTGRLAVVDNLVCRFSIKVDGKSMDPLITPGSQVAINRCFKDIDLTEGAVVLYNESSSPHFGVIRHRLPLDPIVYKISDEKAPQLLHDIVGSDIIGIVKGVDVGKSKYQSGQKAESFILNANDFLTDLYLAKIPRGVGIEMATVQKTVTFSRRTDKFCSVIIHKIKLTSVDVEIIDAKTNKTAFQQGGIVFDTTPSPNINCHEFGAGAGMLNLDPGVYRYHFLINHQALANIEFEVKY